MATAARAMVKSKRHLPMLGTYQPVEGDPWTLDSKLRTLRQVGISRLRQYRWRPGIYEKYTISKAGYQAFMMSGGGEVILDIGCGESPDRLVIASNYPDDPGVVIGVDLFRPHEPESLQGFVQANGIALPLLDQSVDLVICQAMIDLVKPERRIELYREVARVIKPYGVFGFLAQPLADGWGTVPWRESHQIQGLGFHPSGHHLFLRCDGERCWHNESDAESDMGLQRELRHERKVFEGRARRLAAK